VGVGKANKIGFGLMQGHVRLAWRHASKTGMANASRPNDGQGLHVLVCSAGVRLAEEKVRVEVRGR